MRIRITQRLGGSIDGIQLGRFRLGRIYDVGTAIGCYLLSSGGAEPVGDDAEVAVTAPASQTGDAAYEDRLVTLTPPRLEADDRETGRRLTRGSTKGARSLTQTTPRRAARDRT